jgi:hypothetical protein
VVDSCFPASRPAKSNFFKMIEAYETFETGLSILFNEPEINNGDAGQEIVLKFDDLPKLTLIIPDTGKDNLCRP